MSDSETYRPADVLDDSIVRAIIIDEALDSIVNSAANVLYDKYLKEKEESFFLSRTVESLKLLMEWQYPSIDSVNRVSNDFDGPVSVWTCEEEPEPCSAGNWIGRSLPIRQASQLQENTQVALEKTSTNKSVNSDLLNRSSMKHSIRKGHGSEPVLIHNIEPQLISQTGPYNPSPVLELPVSPMFDLERQILNETLAEKKFEEEQKLLALTSLTDTKERDRERIIQRKLRGTEYSIVNSGVVINKQSTGSLPSHVVRAIHDSH